MQQGPRASKVPREATSRGGSLAYMLVVILGGGAACRSVPSPSSDSRDARSETAGSGQSNQATKGARPQLASTVVLNTDPLTRQSPQLRISRKVTSPAGAEQELAVSIVPGAGCATLSLDRPQFSDSIHRVLAIGALASPGVEVLGLGETNRLTYGTVDGEGRAKRTLLVSPPGSADVQSVAARQVAIGVWLVEQSDGTYFWVKISDESACTWTVASLADKGALSAVQALDGGYLVLAASSRSQLYRVDPDMVTHLLMDIGGINDNMSELESAVYGSRWLVDAGSGLCAFVSNREIAWCDVGRMELVKRLTIGADHTLGSEGISEVAGDGSGGVLVSCEGRLYCIQRSGRMELVADLMANGRASNPWIEGTFCAQAIGPVAGVWSCDGFALFRSTGEEPECIAVTREPDVRCIAYPDSPVIDSFGRVVLQDARTQSIHVFDESGARLFVCTLPREHRPQRFIGSRWVVSGDGRILVACRVGYCLFDVRGRYAGCVPASQQGNSLGALRSGNSIGRQAAAMDTSLFEILRRRRRPDGSQVGEISAYARAASGQYALIESQSRRQPQAIVHVYDRDGSGLFSVALPQETATNTISAGRRWIVCGGYGPRWTMVRVRDRTTWSASVGEEDAGNWCIGQDRDGGNLVLLNARTMSVLRYPLPDE